MKVNLRPVNENDIVEAFGEPFSQSMRGVAIEIDGELMAVGGVLHTSPLQAFSTVLNEKVRTRKVLRPLREGFMDVLSHYKGRPVFAIPSCKYEGSERFLRFFGFEKFDDGIYRWLIPYN